MAILTTEKLERSLRRGLTVRELIEELQNHDENAKVVFQCDYGDYHHTQQALVVENVTSTMDEAQLSLVETAYSKSGLAVRDGSDDEIDDDEGAFEQEGDGQPIVVILS